MLNRINSLIDNTTMYKTLIYVLSGVTAYALLGSLVGKASFSPIEGLVTLGVFLITGVGFNKFIAKAFSVKPHQESQYITSMILFLLFTPTVKLNELIILMLVSLVSTLSKYLIAKNKTHIFNPVALGAFFGTLVFSYSPSWWVGSAFMLPATTIAAIVVFRKQRKFTLGVAFFAVTLATMGAVYLKYYSGILEFLTQSFLAWPIVFFASIMLTEPFTLPTRKKHELVYAGIVGFLAAYPFHFGRIGSSPELALLIGNLIVFLWVKRSRFILKLVEKKNLNANTFEYVFQPDKKVNFVAGQYMEVMLPHGKADSRGERRYFTIASAPSESYVAFGIRVREDGSSFKSNLNSLQIGQYIYGQQLRGDFVLDKNSSGYVFVAGGIGVTPFISMVRENIAKNTSLNATLFFICDRQEDFVYLELLENAKSQIGINYLCVDRNQMTGDFIKNNVADLDSKIVYISGPSRMVDVFKARFSEMGVKPKNIRTDFFNGL